MPSSAVRRPLLSSVAIGTRLAAVAGVWSLGFAVTVGSAALAYREIRATEATVEAARTLALDAERTRGQTAGLAAAERSFALAPTGQGADAITARLAASRDAARSLEQRASATGLGEAATRVRDAIDTIAADLDTLMAARQRIGAAPGEGLAGALTAALDQTRSELNKVSKSGQNPATIRIVAAFAQLNQAKAEYLLRHDDVSLGAFEAAATKMQRQIAQAEIPDDAKARLDGAVAASLTAFAALTAASGDLIRLSDRIGLSFDLVGPALDAVLEGARTQSASAEAALSEVKTLVGWILAITMPLTVFLGGAASILIGRGITRPLRQLREGMARLVRGEEADVEGVDRRDEIGEMARAVAVFRDHGRERASLESEARRSAETRAARQAAMEDTVRAFREDVQRLTRAVASTMQDLRETAGALSRVSDVSRDRAGAAAAASEGATMRVGFVASSAEELATSIDEIARQVARTTATVTSATENARLANDRVASLADAASRVGEVVTLIQSIAEKTNLLALNATIEAARAGEAGRGFAVVAAEVKSLANQTAQATGQISAQIGAIQASTGDAVASISEIAGTMEEVDRTTAAIASAVEEQGAATAEISRNVQDARAETEAVSTNVADVSRSVVETTRSADAVNRAAAEMASRTEEMEAAIERFLRAVAA